MEHTLVLIQRAINQSGVRSTSLNTIALQESTVATSNVDEELFSCLSKHEKIIQYPINVLSSPFKNFKCAILTTLSLVQLNATKAAIIYSK